jgi:hypothetical protein
VINATRSLDAPASLAAARHYNLPDVVDALLRDFLGKCYLCELPISVRAHCIDHRRPQARFPELVFAWHNLFPTCRDCNERRPAYPAEGLLDPATDDVESRLHQTLRPGQGGAETPSFTAIDPLDACAAATARELEHLHNQDSLKAAELRAAIAERIDEVLTRLLDFDAHASATRGPVRQAWEAGLRHDFSRRAPFTALVRGRLGAACQHLFD